MGAYRNTTAEIVTPTIVPYTKLLILGYYMLSRKKGNQATLVFSAKLIITNKLVVIAYFLRRSLTSNYQQPEAEAYTLLSTFVF